MLVRFAFQRRLCTASARLLIGISVVLVLAHGAVPLGRCGAAAAHADEQNDRARARFAEGQAHFAAGRYREAAEAYQAAYAIRPLPGFLFNLGQCYRNLKDPSRAISYYKAYLAEMPRARNAEAVRRTIAELEDDLRRSAGPAAPRPAPVLPTPAVEPLAAAPAPRVVIASRSVSDSSPADRPIYQRWWFWTGIAVLVAGGAAAGAVLGTRGGTTLPPPMGSLATLQPGPGR